MYEVLVSSVLTIEGKQLHRAVLNLKKHIQRVSWTNRNSMIGVKSMVASAGSPGMSGMREVHPRSSSEPTTQSRFKLKSI